MLILRKNDGTEERLSVSGTLTEDQISTYFGDSSITAIIGDDRITEIDNLEIYEGMPIGGKCFFSSTNFPNLQYAQFENVNAVYASLFQSTNAVSVVLDKT